MTLEMTGYEDDLAELISDDNAIKELNGSTRCDACGSRAYVAMAKPEHSELLFCLHHFQQHEFALAETGWFTTIDIRDTLVAKETSVHA